MIETDEPDGGVIKAGLGEVAQRTRETFEQAVENAQRRAGHCGQGVQLVRIP